MPGWSTNKTTNGSGLKTTDMATYGFECRDANGNLLLSTDGRYARLVYYATKSGPGSVTLAALNNKLSIQFTIALTVTSPTSPNMAHIPPFVWRSGNTISWGDWHGRGETGVFQVLVFIYT